MLKDIFNILMKTFYRNKIVYITNTPKDEILDLLDTLFTEKKGLFKSPNLTGEFINFPFGFWIKPKWSSMSIQGGGSPASIKASIIDWDKNKTKIEIIIKPHLGFGIMFILLFVLALYNLFQYLIIKKSQESLFLSLFLLLVFLPAFFLIIKSTTLNLKNNFQNYLGISENENKILQ